MQWMGFSYLRYAYEGLRRIFFTAKLASSTAVPSVWCILMTVLFSSISIYLEITVIISSLILSRNSGDTLDRSWTSTRRRRSLATSLLVGLPTRAASNAFRFIVHFLSTRLSR